jgi:ADP-heptose:LPS heptosyltransferase
MDKIVYSHSGGHGDMIYSLAVCKRIGKGYYKTNFDDVYYQNIKPLLEEQPYIIEVLPKSSLETITHNLDDFRNMQGLGEVSLLKNHLRTFNLSEDNWNDTWLTITPKRLIEGEYALVNVTPRYPAIGFDWQAEIDYLKEKYKQVYYVGYQEDMTAPFDSLKYVKTNNALELAQLINDATITTCNQSFVLTIAQGLGKPYRLMVADNHTNCIHNVPNETLLNR